MSKSLTAKALQEAANDLGIELAAIRAVDEVESRGDGFTDDGRVKILFERHKFHSLTDGKFSASHPKISNPKSGGYGAAGAHQYARFSEAFALDPDAAMKSTSWGRYQIMGFNHRWAGFNTVGEFVDAMKVSEDEHLKAFVKLIKAWGLTLELKSHDWAGFARQYNGAGYKRNKYDAKLAAAYERFKREPLVTDSVTEELKRKAEEELQKKGSEEIPASPQPEQPTPQINVEHADQVKADSPLPVEGGRKDDDPMQASQGGTKSTIATIIGGITGIGTAIGGWLSSNGSLAMVGIICLTVVLLSWMYRQLIMDYFRMKYMSDPTRLNVK